VFQDSRGYDPLYIDFLYYFNVEQDYYECHEVLEELWLEEGREWFYQGLLQVAVGLYHFQNDNLGGAIKMLTAALEKLEDYPDEWMGIQLEQLRSESKEYLVKLREFKDKPFSFTPLRIEMVDSELREKVDNRRKD
jgi:uncharacterized protein